MDFDNIKKVLSSLSTKIDNDEKIALSLFSIKLASASENHPNDYTIGMISGIVDRMNGGNKLFITRAEIKDLYSKLYSRNTKFAEVFKEELGEMPKLASPKLYDRSSETYDDKDRVKEAYAKFTDPVLAHALDVAFGNETKGFSEVFAKSAKSTLQNKMYGFNIASKVDVVNGTNDVIICRADFETPKGITSVYVPVEVSENKTLIPSVFVGNDGPDDLTNENITNYVSKNAGKILNINDKIVLQAALASKGKVAEISPVDIALTKLNAEKETIAFSQNQIVGQKVDKEEKNLILNTPKYQDKEMETFAEMFNSPQGVANYKFSDKKVKLAGELVSKSLNNFGLSNYQIKVCDNTNDSVIYAVSLDAGKVAFKVPVKIAEDKVLPPSIMIAAGNVENFSANEIKRLFKKEASDHKLSAFTSSNFGAKPSDLVDIVSDAVSNEEYAKAEDALNVLAQSGDEKAYRIAFGIYSNGLTVGKKVEAKSACSRIVKTSASKHELCGHTGLPLHKVYQDKYGDCLPMTRKAFENSSDGNGSGINAKIFNTK